MSVIKDYYKPGAFPTVYDWGTAGQEGTSQKLSDEKIQCLSFLLRRTDV